MVALANDAELFHTTEHEAFATFDWHGCKQTWAIDSREFRRYLEYLFHSRSRKVPSANAVKDACNVLKGQACFEGSEREVFTRIAEHDGAIYFDLANDKWQVVKVDVSGWEVVDNPPVKFRRARGMRPLPTPVHGGSVDDLRAFINVDAEQWPLFVGGILGAMRPKGPFPVIVLSGEHGSAKTSGAGHP